MKASIVDLRYKMNDVLKALGRNERVFVFYRGKEAGVILPSKPASEIRVKNHPFFGSEAHGKSKSVASLSRDLRQGRTFAI